MLTLCCLRERTILLWYIVKNLHEGARLDFEYPSWATTMVLAMTAVPAPCECKTTISKLVVPFWRPKQQQGKEDSCGGRIHCWWWIRRFTQGKLAQAPSSITIRSDPRARALICLYFPSEDNEYTARTTATSTSTTTTTTTDSQPCPS